MVKPRNTLVLVKLIQQSDRLVGAIVKPTANEEHAEAEVIAVGPGNIAAAGGVSDTFDLKPGQRVLLLAKQPGRDGMKLAGIPVTAPGGTTYHLYEQGRVLAIVSEPSVN